MTAGVAPSRYQRGHALAEQIEDHQLNVRGPLQPEGDDGAAVERVGPGIAEGEGTRIHDRVLGDGRLWRGHGSGDKTYVVNVERTRKVSKDANRADRFLQPQIAQRDRRRSAMSGSRQSPAAGSGAAHICKDRASIDRARSPSKTRSDWLPTVTLFVKPSLQPEDRASA